MTLDSKKKKISLVFILLLDIAPNLNTYEDISHAQPSSEHFSSYIPALARVSFLVFTKLMDVRSTVAQLVEC